MLLHGMRTLLRKPSHSFNHCGIPK
jgi:hypothetical protein